MLGNILTLLGGRAAEQLVLNDICTGASNDIQRATKIARDMITKYGMSETLGPISFSSENDEVFLGMNYGHSRDYSEEIAAQIDAEVRKIIDTSYENCLKILNDNMSKLHNVANALLKTEKLDGEEFERIFAIDELINDSDNDENTDCSSETPAEETVTDSNETNE